MTDVLLINPKSIDVLPSYLPYGLLYIAGFLREKGIKVKIFDANTAEENFTEVLKKEKPKIAGISILSGPCLTDAVEKARLIKKLHPKIKIVFGGIHTTIFPSDVLAKPYVDYIVMNEGEFPMLELAEYLLKRKGDLKEIKNLGYKVKKKLFLNPIRPFINLDDLPLPAWDMVPVEKYIHQKFYSNRVTTLHTSRGCPWSCAYCYNQAVNFRRWRGMSAEKIIEQIEYLIENYNIKGFQFYDDEFDVNAERVRKFCNLLLDKKIKIKWAHYSRTNIANKERYELEKKAGCEFVEFGVESGSPRILKMIQKQQTVENIKNAFKICQKVGLKSGAMFMIGLPTEKEKEIKMTVKLIKSLGAHQTINTIFHPYPGSFLFDYSIEKNLFKLPKNLEEQGPYFDIGNTSINVSEVSEEYLKRVNSYFYFLNIKNEILLCLGKGNVRLLFYYLKKLLNRNIVNSLLEKTFSFLKIEKQKFITEKKFYQYLDEFGTVLDKYGLHLKDFLKHSRSYNYGSINFIRKIEQNLPQKGNLLEIGSGMGFLTYVMSSEGFKVEGLEVEKPTDHDFAEKSPLREKFRTKIWREIEQEKGARIRFYDGQRILYKNDTFDGVIFEGVLEHVHPKELPCLMKEARRVLKKGGLVFVSRCPSNLSYAEHLARLLYGYSHTRLYSKSQLEKIFLLADLKILNIERTDFFLNFFPDPWMGILNKFNPVIRNVENLVSKTPLSLISHNYEIITKKT